MALPHPRTSNTLRTSTVTRYDLALEKRQGQYNPCVCWTNAFTRPLPSRTKELPYKAPAACDNPRAYTSSQTPTIYNPIRCLATSDCLCLTHARQSSSWTSFAARPGSWTFFACSLSRYLYLEDTAAEGKSHGLQDQSGTPAKAEAENGVKVSNDAAAVNYLQNIRRHNDVFGARTSYPGGRSSTHLDGTERPRGLSPLRLLINLVYAGMKLLDVGLPVPIRVRRLLLALAL